MKTIFELSYRTEQGSNCNVMFSSLRKANKALKNFYFVGACSPVDGSRIESSFIIDRNLF